MDCGSMTSLLLSRARGIKVMAKQISPDISSQNTGHPSNLNVAPQIEQVRRELVSNGSIELIDTKANVIDQGKDLLPSSMSVYVPVTSKRSLNSILPILKNVKDAGFNPIPHIAARRIAAEQDLNEFLNRAVNEADIHSVLLIAGDIDTPVGPYRDSLDVLRTDILPRNGIREVTFAGYPEGHFRISQEQLIQALREKLLLADGLGLGTGILTQFCFIPTRIIQYCTLLGQEAPGVSVYVGMAGPTNPLKLLRYAKICGVSVSMRAMRDFGIKAATLAFHTDPSEQLNMVAHHCATDPSCNIIGAHFFSFGGFVETSNWMNDVIGNQI